jgi:hypothetical protein
MDIALYTIRTIAFIITQPITLVWIAMFGMVFYRQNKKTAIMQKMIIGESINSPFELTISQIVIGILAGVLGSVMLSCLGVMFDENSAIFLIFLVSIMFMFINPKFICFSYSGAFIGLVSVILSQIAMANKGVVVNFFGNNLNLTDIDFLKIDVVALMSLVGVLHIVEGILVVVDGKKGAIPVFSNREGSIIGGFALKRYWILPIALMMMTISSQSSGSVVGGTSYLSTPNWWPLIKPSMTVSEFNKVVISMLPLFGGIGFSSVTFTQDKAKKTYLSGGLIFGFGLLLTLVAQLGNINLFTKIFVLCFAPLAHEGMLFLNRYIEKTGKSRFVSTKDSIMVLDVAPNTPAQEMGIKSGDLIVEINNRKIESEEQMINIMSGTSSFFWLKVQKPTGEFEEVHYNKMNESKRLGIVFVPMGVPKDSMVIKFDEGKFSDVLNKIKNKKDD